MKPMIMIAVCVVGVVVGWVIGMYVAYRFRKK
jgi:hypothetical protein